MSGASMNEIKARMKSVGSTMQITKAMELVATSKLRRARINADRAKEFCTSLEKTVAPLLSAEKLREGSPRFSENEEGRVLYIVIAGDRGLAGGYNANIFRTVASLAEWTDPIYLPIGKKAVEYFDRRGAEVIKYESGLLSEFSVGDCYALAKIICDGFAEGRFSRVEIVYTEFISMLTQLPQTRPLLPLSGTEDEVAQNDIILDCKPEDAISGMLPSYIGGLIYYATCRAEAAESAARRTAMDSASKNAEEMINGLTLNFNRARQAQITQEITEIVSGAEAL